MWSLDEHLSCLLLYVPLVGEIYKLERWIHYGVRLPIKDARFASGISWIQVPVILELCLWLQTSGEHCDQVLVGGHETKRSATTAMVITINAETGFAALINKMNGINLTGREEHLK